MILQDYIAVTYKYGHFKKCTELLSPEQYAALQEDVKAGFAVILEAWQLGKCISN